MGKMTGYRLSQPSSKAFNDIVLDAAAKIPADWDWLPAKENGRNINSEYQITVIFESVKK